MRTAFRVTGRVQGVGFRWWAEAQAQSLGLAGFVRNEPDGAVSGCAISQPTRWIAEAI
ncbi:MAG TPA: acylphosphatase [Holophagaceae bacterium]|nr:acylphosphatase [Holophagaceae bacterium]